MRLSRPAADDAGVHAVVVERPQQTLRIQIGQFVRSLRH